MRNIFVLYGVCHAFFKALRISWYNYNTLCKDIKYLATINSCSNNNNNNSSNFNSNNNNNKNSSNNVQIVGALSRLITWPFDLLPSSRQLSTLHTTYSVACPTHLPHCPEQTCWNPFSWTTLNSIEIKDWSKRSQKGQGKRPGNNP